MLHNFGPTWLSRGKIVASNGPNMQTPVRHKLMKDLWIEAGTSKNKIKLFAGQDIEKHFTVTVNLLAKE